jgi:dynein heavy chain, axonemal
VESDDEDPQNNKKILVD